MFGKQSARPAPKSYIRAATAYRTFGRHKVLNAGGVSLAAWLVGPEPGPDVPTVVFIHGNSAGKEVFSSQLEAFANERFALVALDLPGHGESHDAADPSASYTVPGYAMTIKRALDELGVTAPLVVGWSLGGHIALEMAGRGFGLAGALICGTPPIAPGLADVPAAFMPSEVMATTGNADATPQELKTYSIALYGTLSPVPDLFVAAAQRTDGRARARMMEHWGAGEGGVDQKIVSAGWERPICVVHGAEDAFVAPDYLHGLRWGALWSGAIIELPGVGHAPFLETPDRFNASLAGLMKDTFSS